MTDLFKIKILYSTSHWLFPKIVIGILLILGTMMIISEVLKKARAKTGGTMVPPEKKRFFCENYDKLKLFGGFILFVFYILAMEWTSFLPASIIFMFLFNLLFAGSKEKKSISGSAAIAVITSVVIWYTFGIVFNITLP